MLKKVFNHPVAILATPYMLGVITCAVFYNPAILGHLVGVLLTAGVLFYATEKVERNANKSHSSN